MTDLDAHKLHYHDILWIRRATHWDQVVVEKIDWEKGQVFGRYQDYSNPQRTVFGHAWVPFAFLHWDRNESHTG